ncbi:probable histone-arginine methyltransferase 1.3, partial [Tanacetum coccineum]
MRQTISVTDPSETIYTDGIPTEMSVAIDLLCCSETFQFQNLLVLPNMALVLDIKAVSYDVCGSMQKVDIYKAKLYRLGEVQSLCVSEGSETTKEDGYGSSLANGTVSSSKIKFDDKIEASSAKMYFHYYGQLLHQQNMMQDYVRTDFAGRVVVDVGAGSGILSLFAAQ